MGVKQVIVMRTKYPDGAGGFKKLRTGKLCAQAAHASMKVLCDLGKRESRTESSEWTNRGVSLVNTAFLVIPLRGAVKEWLEGVFTKVVCYVETEEELRALYQKALDAHLPCSLIEDNGMTEFHGVKTVTAIAIGPAKSEDLDPITGELPLL